MTERRIVVPSDAAQLPVLLSFVQEFWSHEHLPAAQAMAFELALEEIFTNVVMHGSPPGSTPQVEVSFHLVGDDLTLTVADNGPPFNPLSAPAPDVSAGLAERPVGGHGVHLVRKMMDAVRYQRVGVHNRLSMTRRLAR